MRKGRKIVLPCVFLALVVAAVAWFATRSSKAKSGDYNLLLISIDTLRADRLGMYGYNRETSPNLDSLAKESAVFSDLVSATSWTLPAHVSIFTGLYPSSHGVTQSKDKIGDSTTTIPQILKQKGYRTFAFTGGGYVGGRYGFDKGFESYAVHKAKKRDGHYDLPRSLELMKKKLSDLKEGEKYFVFLHTFDAHCPYNSPEPYMSMFNSEGAAEVDAKKCGDSYYNRVGISDAQALYLSDRYDGGIRFVDSKLGELFQFLKERGDLERTVIIITSDHGEEFHEHGKIGHKRSLYKELIKIPLIIHAPGLGAAIVREQVGQVDIMPTALELLGIEIPKSADGESLLPFISNPQHKGRKFQLSELHMEVNLRSHMDQAGHLIRNLDEEKNQYFDLEKDPHEKTDISAGYGDEVKRRNDELTTVINSLSKEKAADAGEEGKEELEKLRSLGYLD